MVGGIISRLISVVLIVISFPVFAGVVNEPRTIICCTTPLSNEKAFRVNITPGYFYDVTMYYGKNKGGNELVDSSSIKGMQQVYIENYNLSNEFIDGIYKNISLNDDFINGQRSVSFVLFVPGDSNFQKVGIKSNKMNLRRVAIIRKNSNYSMHGVVQSRYKRKTQSIDEGFSISNGYIEAAGIKLFPLGVFTTFAKERDLKRIKAAGFNTVLSYNYGNGEDYLDFLKLAQRNNLYVIYSLKDFYKNTQVKKELISRFNKIKSDKLEANILGWYINDELSQQWGDELSALYQYIKRSSTTTNIVLQVLDKVSSAEAFLNSTDVLSVDLYPIGMDENFSSLSSVNQKLNKLVEGRPDNSSFGVVQIMDWAVYKKGQKSHLPSRLEIVNQAYQEIIAGSKGLLFYSYHDLFFDDIRRVNSDINRFKNKWKAVSDAVLEVSDNSHVFLLGKNEIIISSDRFKLPARVFYDTNKKYFLVANPFNKKISLIFDLKSGRYKDCEKKSNDVMVNNHSISIVLVPYGYKLLCLM
ncbi:hypothetical protein [Serratia fonticola]|uniref:Uncharacterized protein n=1 Tax=Serratia fonticola TaxID=47917 RepID=A0AAW3WPX9_SERFO|nr:hypothetical protein [Serratia fonticola]MBC3212856.1 hypothetical protein [Serratia fonticola]NYA14420.1 hypothetical protein [Serratia fonticola]NYA34218.1 hypothetical protein [Serratia fonticola]